MEVRLENDWIPGLVPKQIASVLVGFKTRPLWRNQLWREETHHWRLQRLLDKVAGERTTKSRVFSAYYYGWTPWGDKIEAIGETWIVKRMGPKTQSCFSNWANVVSAIPQGSILGPLLFIIYINELPDICDSQLLLYADMLKFIDKYSIHRIKKISNMILSR